jgi:hypothetical protein
MPKSRPSLKDRIVVCLVGLLVFSLLLTMAGFVASYGERRKMNAFASDSHSVNGTVTNKYTRIVSQDQVYWLYVHNVSMKQENWLDVSFQAQDGTFHYESSSVANTIFGGAQVGSPIKVTYVRSNPDWFYVANDVPTDSDVAIFVDMYRYGAIGSLLLLIVLAVSVFWHRGDATSVGQTASRAQRSEVSFRPPRPLPRTGFGKR